MRANFPHDDLYLGDTRSRPSRRGKSLCGRVTWAWSHAARGLQIPIVVVTANRDDRVG